MSQRYLSLLAPLAIGALFTLCFAPYQFWWLCLPLLVAQFQVIRWRSPKWSFWQGYFFGLGYFGAGVSWVYVSIHEHGNAPPILAGFLTFIFAAGLALFTAFQWWCAAKVARGHYFWASAVAFCASWVLFEWVRSWLLTGFPWLLLGNLVIESPLAGYAPILGVFGCSLLLLLTALSLTYVIHGIRHRNVRTTVIVGTSSLIIWGGGLLLQQISWTKPTEEPLSVAFVQANVAQAEKWKRANRFRIISNYQDMLNELWSHDLIILPETAFPMFRHDGKTLLTRLDAKAKETQTALAMGILTADFRQKPAAVHNSFMVIGEGSGEYHKQKLVPFGEYVPLESVLRGLIEFFDLPMSQMQPGPAEQSYLVAKGFRLMPYICYEIVYPDFVARSAGDADLLVTVSNDSWFGTSIGPHQHMEIARMRALENQKYLLRGTNNGITAVIDSAGHITDTIPQFEAAVLQTSMTVRSGSTPFSQIGSSPTLFSCLLLLFLPVLLAWKHKREEPNHAVPSTSGLDGQREVTR